jgi:hypothetical protein
MRYTVYWRDPARVDMLALLLRAADKPAVFAAGRRLERLLMRRPRRTGEGRASRNQRIAFVRPLVVLFTVYPDERVVFVERVRWVGD